MGYLFIVQENFASGRPVQSSHKVEKGGFAGTGRACQNCKFPPGKGDGYTCKGMDKELSLFVGPGHIHDINYIHNLILHLRFLAGTVLYIWVMASTGVIRPALTAG